MSDNMIINNYNEWLSNPVQATEDIEEAFRSSGADAVYCSQIAVELVGIFSEIPEGATLESLNLDSNFYYVANTLAQNDEFGSNNELFSENEAEYLKKLMLDGKVTDEEIEAFNNLKNNQNNLSNEDSEKVEEIGIVSKDSSYNRNLMKDLFDEEEKKRIKILEEDGLEIENIEVSPDGKIHIDFDWFKFFNEQKHNSLINDWDGELIQTGLDKLKETAENMTDGTSTSGTGE